MSVSCKRWQALRRKFAFCWTFVCGCCGFIQCYAQCLPVFGRHSTVVSRLSLANQGFLLCLGAVGPTLPSDAWKQYSGCKPIVNPGQDNRYPLWANPVTNIPSGTRAGVRMRRKPSLSSSSSSLSHFWGLGMNLIRSVGEIFIRVGTLVLVLER